MSDSDNDRQAFINYRSGTFSPTSQEWVISADQWIQTYYQFRDGKLYLVENDNKEQTYNETEINIPSFIHRYAGASTDPYPAIVTFLRSL